VRAQLRQACPGLDGRALGVGEPAVAVSEHLRGRVIVRPAAGGAEVRHEARAERTASQ